MTALRRVNQIIRGSHYAPPCGQPCVGCGGAAPADAPLTPAVVPIARSAQSEVLFVCQPASGHKGLGWNAWHSCNVLRAAGVTAEWVQVGSEKIAGEIKRCSPRVVVIMAFWFAADLLAQLARDFASVVFVVKNHSGPQFLAQEKAGWSMLLAMSDIASQCTNVRLATVKTECAAALRAVGVKTVELPNVYSPNELGVALPQKLPGFHVGLFGAYRTLKNAVGMTFAVVLAASRSAGRVTLHVNGSRSEMGAVNDAGVISELCERGGVDLVRHGWLDHEPFKRLAGSMHVALAATFSETYNYVAADCVTAGTPVIGSDAIFWLPQSWRVNPDSTEDIAAAIRLAPRWPVEDGMSALREYNVSATRRLLATIADLRFA